MTGVFLDLVESDGKPLHLLAVEAILASIAAPGLIAKVIVDKHWLRIVRGSRELQVDEAFLPSGADI